MDNSSSPLQPETQPENQPVTPEVQPIAPSSQPEPTPVQSEPTSVVPTPSISANSSQPPQPKPAALDGDTKIFAALSYLSVLFIIPWVVKKDIPFVAFHIKRGIALFVAELVVWFLLWLVESFLLTLFSLHAAGAIKFLYQIAWLGFAGLSLIGVYFAISGKEKSLPWVEAVAKNIKI
ncbi:MAG: hypothetical protein V1807_01315 [Patescibacteria group bacterium]